MFFSRSFCILWFWGGMVGVTWEVGGLSGLIRGEISELRLLAYHLYSSHPNLENFTASKPSEIADEAFNRRGCGSE